MSESDKAGNPRFRTRLTLLGMAGNLRLRTKLTLLMSVVIAFIALFIYVLLPMHLEEQATNAAHDKAWSVARMAAFSVAPAVLFDDRIAANEALAGVRALPDVDYVIVTKNSKRFVEYHRHSESGPSAATFEIAMPVNAGRAEDVGSLRLGVSLDRLRAERDNDRRAAGIASLLVLLLGAIAVAGISRLMTRPLKEIADAARRIEAGDLTSRAKVRYDDEVGQLARTFNRMLDSVARAQDQLTNRNRGLESKVVLQTGELAEEAEERELLERRIRLLLESTYDGILSVDASGNCTLINRSAAATIGIAAPALIGRSPHTVLHGSECRLENCDLAAVVDGDIRASVNTTFRRTGGESVDLELSSAPIIDDGVRVGSVITFHDVTERESLRRNLEDARRITSLGHVAAMMAHEFNNVLMGIHALVEVLYRQSESSPQARHACELIMNSIRRGKRVTEEVLRYTRPRDPVRTPVNVRAWLQEFIPAIRPMLGSEIEIDLLLPPDDVGVVVDREQFEQVFANLLTNAKHAMPAGGRITIRVAKSDEASIVVFEVSDEGDGILPELLPRIFEPFFTTKRSGGTGLGLPTVRQIIERHGGTITVQSSTAGTIFRISLPTGGIVDKGVATLPAIIQRSPLRVLLVEDDDTVSAGLRAILEIHGNSVAVARCGAEVVPAIQSFQPDAIVMDVGLPDCDGVDLYRGLDPKQGVIPVVFSTGHGDVGKIREVLASPHVGFLLKPYPIEELLSKLAEVTVKEV
jgi:PAS domain S-box-containing protein